MDTALIEQLMADGYTQGEAICLADLLADELELYAAEWDEMADVQHTLMLHSEVISTILACGATGAEVSQL